VASLFVAGFVVLSWWAQPIAAFFGRRGAWDAADFATLYSAADLVARGMGGLLYQPDSLFAVQDATIGRPSGEALAYLNPPFFAVLLAPLAWLPFDTAFQVWTLFNLSIVAVNALLVWQISRPLESRLRWALLIGFLTLMPVTFALRLGQFSSILALSWTLSYMALTAQKYRSAGVALAPLLIKPELLIPISAYLLWKRHFEVFQTLLPLTAVAVVVSLAVIGIEGIVEYPRFIISNAGDHESGTRVDFMFGWNGLIGGFLGHENPSLVTLLSIPLTVVTLAVLFQACRAQAEAGSHSFTDHWLLITIATVLVDPNFFIQDMFLLYPAVVAFIAVSPQQRSRFLPYVVVGWILLGLGIRPGDEWGINLFSVYLASCFFALAAMGRPRRMATTPAVAVIDQAA
jgi:hypothetical protein